MPPPPQLNHHHHHHHYTALPRVMAGGGGWRRGREGGGGIYCTPLASAHRADGGRSQDLESAPALNRTGREPATTSHGLNRYSGDQLSRGTAGASPQTRCARMRPGDCKDARIVRPRGVLVLHRTEGGTDRQAPGPQPLAGRSRSGS
jgi:hypothetical protein